MLLSLWLLLLRLLLVLPMMWGGRRELTRRRPDERTITLPTEALRVRT